MKIMDLRVDDSFEGVYLHQYPVISTFQFTQDLFIVPISIVQGTSAPQARSTSRHPPPFDDDNKLYLNGPGVDQDP